MLWRRWLAAARLREWRRRAKAAKLVAAGPRSADICRSLVSYSFSEPLELRVTQVAPKQLKGATCKSGQNCEASDT